jgi:hypothetical protein
MTHVGLRSLKVARLVERQPGTKVTGHEAQVPHQRDFGRKVRTAAFALTALSTFASGCKQEMSLSVTGCPGFGAIGLSHTLCVKVVVT